MWVFYNKEQHLEYGIVEKIIAYHIYDTFIFLITGSPVTGKRTAIKSISGILSNTKVLCIGTTGTAALVIGVTLYHYILYLPVNTLFNILSGTDLVQLQQCLQDMKK